MGRPRIGRPILVGAAVCAASGLALSGARARARTAPKARLRKRGGGFKPSSSASLSMLFAELDASGDGELSIDELQAGLKRKGLPSGDDYIGDVLDQYDADRSGTIGKDEFVKYMAKKEKAMFRAFQELDVDSSGEVTGDEIARCLASLGIKSSDSDTKKMLRLLDANGDGRISFEEFKKFAAMLPASQLRGNSVYAWTGASTDRIITNPKDPIKQLVIGAVAGGASRFLTAPLERIRIMMMAGDGVTPFGAVASVLKGEGPAGLWRGCTPKILKVMPGSAIQFATFARVKSLFMRLNKDGDIKPWQTLAAGAAAGFASTIVVYPLNCVAGQMSIPGGVRGNMLVACQAIYSKFGLGGFYKGMTGELVGDVWGMMLGFGLYDLTNGLFQKVVGRKPKSLEKGAVGGATACLSLTTQMPLMLATTRMQIQGLPGYPIQYKSLWDCILQIARKEGVWPALWKGVGPAYVKVFPMIFISYFVNEALTKKAGIGGLSTYDKAKAQ